MQIEKMMEIARVAHQVNRALCMAFGDYTQPEWRDAPEWQRESAVKGVEFRLGNPDAPISAQHEQWMSEKLQAGWKYGEVKDAEEKTHPCLVPFAVLPPEQRAKDWVFAAVVWALANELRAVCD